VGDPALIKNILVKDFHLFTDRSNTRKATDAINRSNLFRLTGDDWKRVRSIVSPAFSSGKMRKNVSPDQGVYGRLCRPLGRVRRPARAPGREARVWLLHDDVIATCAFAIKVG